jgi:hypothetical protein
MAKKKKTRVRRGKIFVSPDGGETVYEQNLDGTRGMLVSKSQLAKDIEEAELENQMIGEGAIELRRQYPTLQKAWDRYKTLWHLINRD